MIEIMLINWKKILSELKETVRWLCEISADIGKETDYQQLITNLILQ